MRADLGELDLGVRRALVAASRERLADYDTPLGLFRKLGDEEGAFLFESAPGGGGDGRYSFFGKDPLARIQAFGDNLVIRDLTGERREKGGVLTALRALLISMNPGVLPEGRFPGGAVGYLGYDVVRTLERLPDGPPSDREIPDADFFLPSLLYTYDHARRTLRATVLVPAGTNREESEARAQALLDEALRLPDAPMPREVPSEEPVGKAETEVVPSREAYMASVERLREAIRDGDVFQVVLSMRLSVETGVDPMVLYRSLRRVNPSPYLFYLNVGTSKIVGSSPEALVTVEGGRVAVKPIAGTRPRGASRADDARLAAELLRDPKERAEHVMLVDLARNDVGRVCQAGSVRVEALMDVEAYSHVLHLVSRVEGSLDAGEDALSALGACFPAGTLSGAPKIRAMELIDEEETVRRGPYGGAVGYMAFNGNLDTAIAIRTFVLHGGRAYVQAGAGIVADSIPEREWEECQRKARALVEALQAAEAGL